jgi:hypothetical protein
VLSAKEREAIRRLINQEQRKKLKLSNTPRKKRKGDE